VAYHHSPGNIFDCPEVDGKQQDGRDENPDKGGRVDDAAEKVNDDGAQSEEDVKECDEGMRQLLLRAEAFVLEFHSLVID
jgi:hypothetical protein